MKRQERGFGLEFSEAAGSGQAAVERSTVPEYHKWDLERIYPDWNTWEADFAFIEEALPELENRRGSLGRSGRDLLETVEAVLTLRQKLEIVFIYASLRSDEDTRIGENTARRGRAGTLATRYAEVVSWLEPELLALKPETIKRFIAQEPGLQLYEHYIDMILRLRDHTLSPDQEALLAAAANMARGAGQVFNAFNNADLKFPNIRDEAGREIELTKARYGKYIKSADRRVRRDAFVACLDSYGAVINTLSANMDSNVKNHVFYARARHYPGTLEAALYPNAIPPAVFHNLIETTNDNLATVHRYTSLKQRVLGLDPLCDYDLYVPLFPEAEFQFEYEEAKELILEALAPLGPEYLDIVREGYDSRWIDVHENVGKRSGAYSNGVYGTSPYILLNWSDQLRDTFTLAHELGHSVHTYLANKHQPYVYGDYPIFTAEVASTCNELLLIHHLIEHTESRNQRLYLLDFFLTQINDTVVRQVMFAEFEHWIHQLGEQGETLTTDLLDKYYLKILARYWGPRVTLDPQRSGKYWARIPHFYYKYYVYQYATAYAAATAISQQILAGDTVAREQYLALLRSGDSHYPVEALQRAGVDMTEPDPVEDVFGLFSGLLSKVDTLLEETE
ncbi:MAG: oligoendopeptidase F [bacterium]